MKYPRRCIIRLNINNYPLQKRGEKSMNKGDLVKEVAKVVSTKKEAQEVVGR